MTDVPLDTLIAGFPFGFALDGAGVATAVGETLASKFALPAGAALDGRLALERERFKAEEAGLLEGLRQRAASGRAARLRLTCDQGRRVTLVGLALTAGPGAAFLGSLDAQHATQIADLDVALSDFGPADSLPSFAVMAELQQAMLADAQALNAKLETAVAEQRALREALAEQNAQLERTVAARTATIARQAEELRAALDAEKALNAMQRSFVSMANHELRTPLAIIDAAAGAISRKAGRGVVDSAFVVAKVEPIRRAVARMTRLMESALEAARTEAMGLRIQPEDVDVAGLAAEICRGHAETAPSHAVRLDVAAAPALMRADPGALTHILSNLVSNAVKYSPEADAVDVTVAQEGVMLRLDVRDYGVGLPDDERDRVFERFFRASTSSGIPGTGIGLNLVKLLVDGHDGTIEVASAVGEGSCFSVRLPLVGPAAAAA